MSIIANLKQLFHIVNKSDTALTQLLLLRVGEKHASFASTNANGTEVYEMGYYSSNGWNIQELDELEKQLKTHGADKVQIALDHSIAFIAPANVSSTIMKSIYNFPPGHLILQEEVPGWQNTNVFVIPQLLQEWVNANFPDATCHHQLTAMMKWVPAVGPAGAIFVDFREHDLLLFCAKSGQLLLSQDNSYSNHEDVLYLLLNACHQLGLSQENVELRISGLIDKNSALYKELYNYFINIEFREPTWKMENKDLPAHFFTSLNDLALCVS